MRTGRIMTAMLLLLALLATGCAATAKSAETKPPAPRPNIVMIMADDLDVASLDPVKFPNIAAVAKHGASFGNFIVSDSWCCPSRASILRSQYVHSHGVETNSNPEGGFSVFDAKGEQNSTIGTWLHSAGYTTAMIGKFLNGYPSKANPTYVPPGWDDWQGPAGGAMYNQYDYTLVSNGKEEKHGHKPEDYLDGVLTAKATDFISTRTAKKPFFVYLTPLAPHLPSTPAPTDTKAFPDAKVPRTAAFDQADVSQEPYYISKHGKMGPALIKMQDEIYRERQRSLLGVDRMVGQVVQALKDSGALKNTYVVFTSDNGFHMGEHRLPAGKTTPYESDIRVPMYVMGPGVKAGTVISDIGATVDLGPTFAALAGAKVPAFAEGRSLVPFLRGRTPAEWRTSALVEFYAGHSPSDPWGPDCDTEPQGIPGCPRPPTYTAIRTDRYTYAEYKTGEKQLYDRQADPEELHNLAKTADPALLRSLADKLAALRACKAATCRTADR